MIELGLPVEDVGLVDVVLDDGQALVDVLDRRRRPVRAAGAARDLLEAGERVLVQLGVADRVDGDAPLVGVGDDLLHVGRGAVVAAVGDDDDRLRRGERAALLALAGIAREERDRLRQPVVEQEALPGAGHLADLAGHLALLRREGRDGFRRLGVVHRRHVVLLAEPVHERARRLLQLLADGLHCARGLDDEHDRCPGSQRLERLHLGDLRAGGIPALVDAEDVRAQALDGRAGSAHHVDPGARAHRPRPGTLLHLHLLDRQLRPRGREGQRQQRHSERGPRRLRMPVHDDPCTPPRGREASAGASRVSRGARGT